MTESKQVLVFPRGAIHPRDLRRLSRAGIVAIEADDPSKVVMLFPTVSLLRGDDLLLAALVAVKSTTYDQVRVNFANALISRIQANKP